MLDAINRPTWARGEVVESYAHADGYSDPGERVLLDTWMSKVRDQPIVDIGVGGGRTTALLLPFSSNYIGVDYTPAMAAACQKRFPQVRILEQDARDLADLPDEGFALAYFSYNGIDSVDVQDRGLVLQSVRRVLRPGGYFCFSALNTHGQYYSHFAFPRLPVSLDAARFIAQRTRNFWRSGGFARHREIRAVAECTRERGLAPLEAHGSQVVAVFTSPRRQLQELRAAGLLPLAAIGFTGRLFGLEELESCADAYTMREPWLHYICQRGDTPAAEATQH